MNLDETILYLKQFKYNKQKETDNSWCEMLVQYFINEKEENSFNRNQVIELMMAAYQMGFEMAADGYNQQHIPDDEYEEFLDGIYKEFKS